MDKIVNVDVEYGRDNLLFGFVIAISCLVVASKTIEFKEIAYEHCERFVKDIAESSVIEVFGYPHRIFFGLISDFSERIVGKSGKEILEQTVYRVNLVCLILARTGHFAFEAFEILERFVVNRHHDRSDFQRHNHIDYALRLGYRNVRSADNEKNISRRAAVKLIENIRTFFAVGVVPLTRFLIVFISADSVGIS